MRSTLTGFQVRVIGQAPRAGAFAGFSRNRMILFAFLISGGLAGLAGICEVAGPIGMLRISVSPGYGFTAIIVAFLGRLNPFGILIAGFVLALTFLGGEGAQIALGLPEQMTRVFQGLLLFYVLACDTFILYRLRVRTRRGRCSGGRRMGMAEGILLTIITAATPLLLAALGELVAERSGVLNLGVEGMMAVGAVCGFAVALRNRLPGARRARRDPRRRADGRALRARHARLRRQPGRLRPGADAVRARPLGPDRRSLCRPPGPRARAARHSRAFPTFRSSAGSSSASTRSPISRSRWRSRVWLVPVPHARRADPPRRRRQPHLGACARLPRHHGALPRGALRRRLRRARAAAISRWSTRRNGRRT